MSTVTKFDIEKFDGKISFSIWRVQMKAVLTHNGLKKALVGKSKMSDSMFDEQWEEFDEKALEAIQLCLSKEVLRDVVHETTAADLWLKLESLYMTKSLANKFRIKEHLYMLRMAEVDQVQLDRAKLSTKFAILMNLESRMVASKDIARQIFTYGERKPMEFFLKAVDQVSVKDITNIAQKLLSTPLKMESYGDVLYLPSYDAVSSKFHL